MTVSFKRFVELIDQEEEVSEEQLTELFGVFRNNREDIIKKKSDEFKARREALKAKFRGTPGDDADELDLKDTKNRRIQTVKTTTWPRNAATGTSTRGNSAAPMGRAVERNWTASMQEGKEQGFMKINDLFESTPVKLKWKTTPAPSGRFRSFEKRAWPTAAYAGTETETPAVMLRCEDDYHPTNAKEGKHKPIFIYVADHSVRERKGPEAQAFEWRKLTQTATTIDEAKEKALKALIAHPDFLPKALRPVKP